MPAEPTDSPAEATTEEESMRKALLAVLVPAAAAVLTGCPLSVAVSSEGHTSSPWEFGPSVRVTSPVFTFGATTVHPMGSYTYLSYDGGHEHRLEGGAQVRQQVGTRREGGSSWLGAELAAAYLKDQYETGSDDYTGWSATALGGIPVQVGSARFGIVGGAGVSRYSSSGWGKNVRLGVEFTVK
jgi:hypothetical protein